MGATKSQPSIEETHPTIVSAEFGKITVQCYGKDYHQSLKDCILGPDLVRRWSWKKNGTSHEGIKVADLTDIFDSSKSFMEHYGGYAPYKKLIFGLGWCDKLNPGEEVLAWLKKAEKGLNASGTTCEVLFLNTEKAVKTYTEAVKKGYVVYAFIHSTC